MLDRETLEKRRAQHRSTKPPGVHGQCAHCMIPGWPCDRYEELTLALEAERLRAEMAEMRRRVNQDAPYSSMMAVTEDWQRRAVNAEREAERLRAASLERTVEWLGEKWEFPCPACGGGCYRSRAAEKKHCYACGHKFEPEIQSALAGTEARR